MERRRFLATIAGTLSGIAVSPFFGPLQAVTKKATLNQEDLSSFLSNQYGKSVMEYLDSKVLVSGCGDSNS